MPKQVATITQKSVAMTAARVVLWAFLVGGACAGFLSAAVLYESIGTATTNGVTHSLSRKAFIDALLVQAVRASAEPEKKPVPEKKP